MITMAVLPTNMQNKVQRDGDCWTWTGAINSSGYGSVGNGHGSSSLAHRVSYEFAVGPIPDGLTIDHLCRNTRCVNPDDLEPVTSAENARRSHVRLGYCPSGHELPGVSKTRHMRSDWKRPECARCVKSQSGFADIIEQYFGAAIRAMRAGEELPTERKAS